MKTFIQQFLENLSLLLIRIILSYGFYEPAKTKWQDIQSVADWFKSLHIPFPLLNAYLSASFEMIGVFLLLIGLFTRWITIPLMFIMMVAISTVHFKNGFAASDNGFEIPLYYFAMLFMLLSFGAGKWSVDFYFKK